MFDHTPYAWNDKSFQSRLMRQANDRAHRWLVRCAAANKRIIELELEVEALKKRLDQS